MSTRLPGAKYKKVFDRGRSLKGRLLVAWHAETETPQAYAGVIATKNTFRHAVDRNRAKRLMREAYRLMVKDGDRSVDGEWIFIARRAISKAMCQDVVGEMRKLCGKF